MSEQSQLPETAFFNTHTHIFTKEHVPKYLAKQMLPKPFYKWFPTVPMVKMIKCYLKQEIDDSPGNINFRKLFRCYLNRNKSEKEQDEKERKSFYSYTARNKRHQDYVNKRDRKNFMAKVVLRFIKSAVTWVVFLFYLFHLIVPFMSDSVLGWIGQHYTELLAFMPKFGPWTTLCLLVLMIFLFSGIRTALAHYIKKKIIKAVGKERLEFLLRYVNIARFSMSSGQVYIFNQLKQQYPVGSKFVVLPMDMEYMDAGPVQNSYHDQMMELIKLKNKKQNKNSLLPFIFADPRRIREHGKTFLNLNTTDPNHIILEDCQVKDYIDGGCVGIKIYPALGYYPFDKDLLALWLYCQQNSIPITTHCSIGPVFYRGDLKDLGENYDLHPIFDEVYEKKDDQDPEGLEDADNAKAANKDRDQEEVTGQLRFHELKNKDFQKNFTHPLNYLCLIHKPLLNKVVETFDTDGELKRLFGYEEGMITRDLSQLKINLAHYGSAPMWQKFLDQDRSRYANTIIKDREKGLDLLNNMEDNNRAKRYQYWHYVDWFSIITTMMLQFDNIYADVSYTSHDLRYLNLLSEILDNPNVAKRVLYGTDFYVVSNHKTEKQYWIDMQNTLGSDRWHQIANQNPVNFLTSMLPGSNALFNVYESKAISKDTLTTFSDALVSKTFGSNSKWLEINQYVLQFLKKKGSIALNDISNISKQTGYDINDIFALIGLLSNPEHKYLKIEFYKHAEKKIIETDTVYTKLKDYMNNKSLGDKQWKQWASEIYVKWTLKISENG